MYAIRSYYGVVVCQLRGNGRQLGGDGAQRGVALLQPAPQPAQAGGLSPGQVVGYLIEVIAQGIDHADGGYSYNFV